MNLRKQVEPLKKAALQASSLQRHAHHAASRLTWVERWLKRAYHHHAQSRELKRSVILVQGSQGSQGSEGSRGSTGSLGSAGSRGSQLYGFAQFGSRTSEPADP